jgi:ATP-binding protein involved in chromosome partitioning
MLGSMSNDESVIAALRTVKYPGYSRDIVSFGLVKTARNEGHRIFVELQLSAGTPALAQQLRSECEKALATFPNAPKVEVEVLIPSAAATSARGVNAWTQQNGVPGIRHVVAVASGKGGVGKSTVSVNLACALHQIGLKTGLLDCDIYGPSIPLMMGAHEKPQLTEDDKMIPIRRHGVSLMSMGFLLDGDTPVIWRGPMIMKTIQQFVTQVEWGELDCLLVDLPPGTGDAQLSLCQTVPLDGGVVVTTPQEASLGVVRKGIAMFEKVSVPILGIIENMSYFTAPGGERVEIFGHGGGRSEAARRNIPFLGEIPIFTQIREGGDQGIPITASAPESVPGRFFLELARSLQKRLK